MSAGPPSSLLSVPSAAFLLAVIVSACGDTTDPAPAAGGGVRVIVSTAGTAPDPDGYELEMADVRAAVQPHDTLVLGGLPPGDASLALSGLAPNCQSVLANPLPVTVVDHDTVLVRLTVSCPGSTGSVQMLVTMEGVDQDHDGFAVAIGDVAPRPVTPGTTVEIAGIPAGEQPLAFPGLRGSCEAEVPARTIVIRPDVRHIVNVRLICGWILASGNRGNGRYGLYRISADGKHIRWIAGDGYEDEASWSPTRRQVVFVSRATWNILIADIDGAPGYRQLTDDPAYETDPSWSPDGTQIVFARGGGENGYPRVHIMNADGTNVRALTTSVAGEIGPVFSPDGSRIAFSGTSSPRTAHFDIWTMDKDGGNRVQLTFGAHNTSPAWSPSGDRIAFTSRSSVTGLTQVFVMAADGSQVRQVTSTPEAHDFPAWSADGDRLAVTRMTGGRLLYTVRPDGTGMTQVSAENWFEWSHDWVR